MTDAADLEGDSAVTARRHTNETKDMPTELSSLLHADLLAHIVETGHAPSTAELSARLDVPPDDVRTTLRELADDHGLVLHPGTDDLWVIPPFSLVPTAHWVENAERGWWAACIWCALGVCALVGRSPRIHTRVAGESRELAIDLSGDTIEPTGLVANFPIPLARAWDNVHRFCGSTLVFENASQVTDWSQRHGYPAGDIQPLETVWRLARRWYGGHLSPTWRKWSRAEAAAIFSSLGLHGPTWELPGGDEAF